jgi:iron only hydrogenase large subunit-like protein
VTIQIYITLISLELKDVVYGNLKFAEVKIRGKNMYLVFLQALQILDANYVGQVTEVETCDECGIGGGGKEEKVSKKKERKESGKNRNDGNKVRRRMKSRGRMTEE